MLERVLSWFYPEVFWRRFVARWRAHRHTDNAAALTFYSLVSLIPVLLVGVTVAGGILGEKSAHGELEKQLSAVVGSEAAAFLERILQSSTIMASGGSFGIIVVSVMLLYSGSHVLTKLRGTLNLINEVEPQDPARPFIGRLLARGLCALLLLIFGALLVMGTVVEGFVAFFADRINTPFISSFQFLQGYQLLSTYLLLTIAFFFILKILPRRRPLWWPAMVGSLFAALAVGSLKSGLDLYLRHSPLASIFGTGVTVLIFLFWLFISIQAFLAGAEITAMLMRKRESAGPLGKD